MVCACIQLLDFGQLISFGLPWQKINASTYHFVVRAGRGLRFLMGVAAQAHGDDAKPYNVLPLESMGDELQRHGQCNSALAGDGANNRCARQS